MTSCTRLPFRYNREASRSLEASSLIITTRIHVVCFLLVIINVKDSCNKINNCMKHGEECREKSTLPDQNNSWFDTRLRGMKSANIMLTSEGIELLDTAIILRDTVIPVLQIELTCMSEPYGTECNPRFSMML